MLRKIILTLLIILICSSPSQSIEEVVLDASDEKNSLKYLADVYNCKIENVDEVSPFLRIFSKKGLEFQNSEINSFKLSLLYSGSLTYNIHEQGSNSLKHKFDVLEPGFKLKFHDNKAEIASTINVLRDISGYRNDFIEKISRLYFAYNFNEHQRFILGQEDRIPATYNGYIPTIFQDFVLRSQLGRNYGNYRSVGIRNRGTYKYATYDIGLYDSTRFMDDFGRGYEAVGYVMLKPFADFENSLKTIRIGSGYDIGEYNRSYNIYSFFLGYDYNRWHVKAEYAATDGSNNVHYSPYEGESFYATLEYDITPKFLVHGRYDYFNPNTKSIIDTSTQEYTVGFVYKINKFFKFFLEFVRRESANKPDSNLILFATRFYI